MGKQRWKTAHIELSEYAEQLKEHGLSVDIHVISPPQYLPSQILCHGRAYGSDVNVASNQIINVAPDAFGPGRSGCVVEPVLLALPNRQHQRANPVLVP